MMNIIFDSREKQLIDIYSSNYITKYKVENLDIGDIHIYNNNNLLCIIERKTMDDLSSSIIDKRLYEQKSRMKNNTCQIIYIIENFNKRNNKAGIPYTSLLSSMCSIIINDNYFVMRTKDINETAVIIKFLTDKLEKNRYINENESYVSQISCSKKKLLTLDNIWTAQISCIPGISYTIAKRITDVYCNFEQLYNTYLFNDRDISFLHDIPKIGPNLSKTIEQYLFQS